ncbi:prepilin peptidase [Sporosarcina limicola]|uniref:Leader peptidase (Prepilin peptidase)/N-methyltransferase n=1 Tax=Sporosarcina limicola TaxID=34101 RepID=A0A927MH78_9BACL|nr:A24 family peptidase [Sporosarcina limicola]MBE1554570.1 leader peptidase (prepilin peptidase)/N-methyltransferase [Sporosarcina limicola]
MTIVIMTLFFLYGIVFGSFFNVVGLRLPKKESIISPPSRCTTCDRRLGVFDLVPVFSYLFLKGKCRGCGSKISAVYPFMEYVTGVLFALSFYILGFSAELVVALLFMSLLVIITVSDIVYMLIPDKVLFPFAVALFGLRLLIPLAPWWDSLLGAVVGFGVLFIIMAVSKGGVGGGDVKLFFVLGLVLGTVKVLLTLFLASVIGSVVGVVFLKSSGQGRKTPIPFGPSIALATIISYFWGANFVAWYGNLFF